ncbi:MAG: hypothetical protein E2O50_00445 [Gammaproteobacteria bacterium]|nr:MAG: hypothetical protein E2O50_00445 [Gammaproteobacteria bacterium]
MGDYALVLDNRDSAQTVDYKISMTASIEASQHCINSFCPTVAVGQNIVFLQHWAGVILTHMIC